MRVRRAVAVAIPVAACLASAILFEPGQVALFAAPVLLLVALWRAGVDPTPLLERVAERFEPRVVRGSRRIGRPMRAPVRVGAVGRLVSLSLAGRAPPVASVSAVA
ncbi:MAG: hypothetical protein WCO96_06455 [Actinomycetes bacterium]